jgi:hypothetical protein
LGIQRKWNNFIPSESRKWFKIIVCETSRIFASDMPSKKAVSRGMTGFEYRENQLAVFLTKVHHPTARGLVECPDTNAGRLPHCRRNDQIVPKVGRGYLAVRHVLYRESE